MTDEKLIEEIARKWAIAHRDNPLFVREQAINAALEEYESRSQPVADAPKIFCAPTDSRLSQNAPSPFANCKYQHCDLPGQCRSEGKCHHPKADAPTGEPPVASMWAKCWAAIDNMNAIIHADNADYAKGYEAAIDRALEIIEEQLNASPPAGVVVPSRSDILQAVARGWCSPDNSHKEMDGTLANAIATEMEAMLAAKVTP